MKIKEERKLYKEAQILAKQLIGLKGVTDIEFGLKQKNGSLTDEVAIRFKVLEKKREGLLDRNELIPKKIGDFVTDVLPSGMVEQVRSENPRTVVKPIIGGIQIQSSLYENSPNYWGTIGCYYRFKDSFHGLTNYHVLYGKTPPRIVEKEYVGKLSVSQNLNRTNNKIGIASRLFNPKLDYATFQLRAPFDKQQSINMIQGLLKSYKYPQIGMPLFKSGARTGITYGIIDGRSCIDCSELSIYLDQNYPNNSGKISELGDSGSIWILNANSDYPIPVALHYARGESPKWAKAKSFASIFASIRNKLKN